MLLTFSLMTEQVWVESVFLLHFQVLLIYVFTSFENFQNEEHGGFFITQLTTWDLKMCPSDEIMLLFAVQVIKSLYCHVSDLVFFLWAVS